MKPAAKRFRNLSVFTAGILGVGVVLFLLAKHGSPVPCVFYELTGLRCPGCGNTRAVLALLHLDFQQMLRMNLLFPAEAGYMVWVFLYTARKYLKTGRLQIGSGCILMDWCFLGLLLIWWIARNLLRI